MSRQIDNNSDSKEKTKIIIKRILTVLQSIVLVLAGVTEHATGG
jgi:hypothetical protein